VGADFGDVVCPFGVGVGADVGWPVGVIWAGRFWERLDDVGV